MRTSSRFIVFCALSLALSFTAVAADPTAGAALRGISKVTVTVDGVTSNFERYGLEASEVAANARARLTAHGITVVDSELAANDASASQVAIQLKTNTDPYGLYSYGLSVKLKRRVTLEGAEGAFVSHTVWSEGQNGVLNPSDLPRIYGYVATLLDAFIRDYNRYNSQALNAAPH